MAKFKITDNVTGKTVTVSGDIAPTEKESEQIFTDAGLRETVPPDPEPILQPDIPTIQKQDSLSVGQVASQALTNFVPSAKQFADDIFQVVKNPKETAGAFVDLVSGTAQLLVPGEQGSEEVARLFGQFVEDRYGTIDAVKQTVASDPVGFAADLSTFITGIGGAVGVTGKVGQLSKVSQLKKAADIVVKSGRGIRNFGAAVDPIGLIGETTKQLARARGPINSLTKTALNIKADIPVRTVDRIAEEFLNRGLNINRKSLGKLDKQNRRLNKTIQNTIDSSVKSNTPIKADTIINVIDELKANAAREGLSATDLKTLDNLKEDFGLVNGRTLTPGEVQDLKVGFNKAYAENLTDQFGAIRTKFFDKARSATKIELEKIWPELKGLNLEQGAGIELRTLINKAINNFEKSPTIRNLGLATGGVGGAVVGAGTDLASGIGFAVTAIIVGNLLADPRTGVRIAKLIRTLRKGTQASSKITRPAFQSGRVQRLTDLTQVNPEGSQSTISPRPNILQQLGGQ